MYKITRVEELHRCFNLVTRKVDSQYTLDKAINDYIKYHLKKHEFLIHVEYFKNNEYHSTYPEVAYLHIGTLIDKKDKRKQTINYY